jgi:hypothetical protein
MRNFVEILPRRFHREKAEAARRIDNYEGMQILCNLLFDVRSVNRVELDGKLIAVDDRHESRKKLNDNFHRRHFFPRDGKTKTKKLVAMFFRAVVCSWLNGMVR